MEKRMNLLREIQKQIDAKKMLSHPFYRDWTEGKLSMAQLQNYAVQYKPFVDAFPRFVSGVHSNCVDRDDRRSLLQNLMDEEGLGDSPPHPILWQNFIDGIEADRKKKVTPEALYFRDTFLDLCCNRSYEAGVSALYAYESQMPDVSREKIEGIKKNWPGIPVHALDFFVVHEKADVSHAFEAECLIDRIDDRKRDIAIDAAKSASGAIWNFLSSVHK